MVEWIKSEIVYAYYGWKLSSLIRTFDRGSVPDLTSESDTFLRLIAYLTLSEVFDESSTKEMRAQIVKLHKLAMAECARRQLAV